MSGDIGRRGIKADNSFRIVSAVNVGSDTIVDGFTVTGSYNERASFDGAGGGLYHTDGAARFRNCTIISNFANSGGGLWNDRGTPMLLGCSFVGNAQAGALSYTGQCTFVNCVFRNNASLGSGGGYLGGTRIQNPVFVGCTFFDNRSDAWGGAYYGIGDPLFDTCLFIGNYADNSAGAVYLRDGAGRVINCAFFGNEARLITGGLATGSVTIDPVLKNCVFWGNRSEGGSLERKQLWLHDGTIDYSCVQGWTGEYGGVGNHGFDPRFVDFEGGDYRLTDGSPCIDAGDNGVVTEPFDLDGNPRILTDVVDMGPYESVCNDVQRLKTRCHGDKPGEGKLIAKLRTTLPCGSTVRLRCDGGDPVRAAIRPNGRGKATWKGQGGRVEVCVSGCPASCSAAECP
ncbi:MAG: hypothetical protein C4547_11965 [Phycisphaerales bacterium]|nr:MAG: hypothetical protein C4547_11965 [Phycisphaerales bacterium]